MIPLLPLLLLVSPPPARPVLVTIDDLPVAADRLHPEAAERARLTGDLLKVLAQHHVKAVAFVEGKNIHGPADETLLGRWVEAGHELGNHTDSHPSLTGSTAEAWIADAERERAALGAWLAQRAQVPRFFRYPFLEEGDTPAKRDAVRAYLARTHQRAVPVTVDTQDWSFETSWVEARRAGDRAALTRIGEDYRAALRLAFTSQEARGDALLGRTAPDILLVHANEVGAAQWDALFGWLESTGHRFATADEVLADPAFAEESSYVGPNGFGLWDRLRAVRREAQAKADIVALLEKQAAAWSAGDLDVFCSIYADDATFASPSGTVVGRAAVLERYRKRYPGKEAMGSLSLEVSSARVLAQTVFDDLQNARPARPGAVVVLATWHLQFPHQPSASGTTQLVLRPRGDSWEIVSDASM
jgi:uncharacterized protein (TIGR02246 family)